MSKRKTTARGISFPDDLLAWLEAEAARDDRSVSYIVVKACEAWREGRMTPPEYTYDASNTPSDLLQDVIVTMCPNCGRVLSRVGDSAVFRCEHCGAIARPKDNPGVHTLAGDLSISDTCPRCGAALTSVDEYNNPGVIRCPECGWTLGGDAIAHPLGG